MKHTVHCTFYAVKHILNYRSIFEKLPVNDREAEKKKHFRNKVPLSQSFS